MIILIQIHNTTLVVASLIYIVDHLLIVLALAISLALIVVIIFLLILISIVNVIVVFEVFSTYVIHKPVEFYQMNSPFAQNSAFALCQSVCRFNCDFRCGLIINTKLHVFHLPQGSVKSFMKTSSLTRP